MSDITYRLRRYHPGEWDVMTLRREAADEIETLRQQVQNRIDELSAMDEEVKRLRQQRDELVNALDRLVKDLGSPEDSMQAELIRLSCSALAKVKKQK